MTRWSALAAAFVIMCVFAVQTFALDATIAGRNVTYDSAYVDFGRSGKNNTASGPGLVIQAGKGCVIQNPPANGTYIAIARQSQVTGQCNTVLDFVRALQKSGLFSGAVVANTYRMPGSFESGLFWGYDDDTSDAYLPVTEVSQFAWDDLSQAPAGSIFLTITLDRGENYYLSVSPGTIGMFIFYAIVWAIVLVLDVVFLFLILRRKIEFNVTVRILLCAIFVAMQQVADNWSGERIYPNLTYYVTSTWFWVAIEIGLLAYTMTVLSWAKAVHLIKGSNFIARHENKILYSLLVLAVIVGIANIVRFITNASVIVTIVSAVIGVIGTIESIVIFYYGFKILNILLHGQSLVAVRSANNTDNKNEKQKRRNQLHRKLTLLIISSGISWVVVSGVSIYAALLGSSPALFFSSRSFLLMMNFRIIFTFVLQNSIVLFLLTNYIGKSAANTSQQDSSHRSEGTSTKNVDDAPAPIVLVQASTRSMPEASP